MESRNSLRWLKWIVLLAFLAMLTVNALSSILPINGVTPKEVSDRYPNLFVPAPLTFSIWGVIYLLVLGYVLYILGLFRKKGAGENAGLPQKTGLLFILSCLFNLSWIIAWHYGLLALSFCVIALLLLTLIGIRLVIAKHEPLPPAARWLVRLPFSVYFGWVTVATIASATALLVGSGFNGFAIPEPVWAIAVVLVGAAIGILTAFRLRDIPYLLVFVWAYANILSNHLSASGFGGRYPGVIAALAVCLAAFVAAIVALLVTKRRNRSASGKTRA
jgi:hypothetical protein